MSLRSRLRHLERLSESVRREPLPCGTCGAPAGFALLLMSWEEGVQGAPDAARSCPECASDPPGRQRVVPDPSSAAQLCLVLVGGKTSWNLRDWLQRHAGRSFGPALDALFARRREEGRQPGP